MLEIGILNKWVWLLVKYDDTKKIMHWLLVFCKNIVNRRINFIELHIINIYLYIFYIYMYIKATVEVEIIIWELGMGGVGSSTETENQTLERGEKQR